MKLEGYSDYEIYPETGQVWSYKSNKFVGAYDKDGYLIVGLVNDSGVRKTFGIHRLVWLTVNGEIPNGMEINHLDENKENNSIHNLSLTTHRENTNWGTRNQRIIKNRTGKFAPKYVVALKEGKVKMFYPSTREAERQTGYSNVHIGQCCNYKRNAAYGYQWRYMDDFLADWWEQEMEKYMENEKGVA